MRVLSCGVGTCETMDNGTNDRQTRSLKDTLRDVAVLHCFGILRRIEIGLVRGKQQTVRRADGASTLVAALNSQFGLEDYERQYYDSFLHSNSPFWRRRNMVKNDYAGHMALDGT